MTVEVHGRRHGVVLDPYDYDFHEDPYPYYKRLRDEAPLYHNEEIGFWALSRHQDVLQGFRNSTTLSNRDGVSLDPISRGPHASKTMSFLAMDDPAHLRLRTLVSKGFTPRRIRELEPRVTELAVQHLDTMLQMADGETVDYVAEFAGKLPMDVISELMGVPVEDRDRIRAMADGVMHREDGVNDVPQSAIEASINLIVYYQQMVADRRKKPSDDLTTALLEAEIAVEQHMGCAMGVCRACVVVTAGGNARVCREGPVFPLGDMRFSEGEPATVGVR